jgi:hypothetical protein
MAATMAAATMATATAMATATVAAATVAGTEGTSRSEGQSCGHDRARTNT